MDNQTDDEDYEENVRMQPYSYRSKQSGKKSYSKSSKHEKVVNRLYTIKPKENAVNEKAIKDMIRVEDNSPNSKIKNYLDNSIPQDSSHNNNFPGYKTLTNRYKSGLSPNKMKIHRHKHSNSDTLVKSSSYKSKQINFL